MEERPVTFVVHFVEAVGSGVRGHGAIRKDFDKTVEYSWFTRQVESMAKSTTHTPYHYAKHPHDDPNVADIPLRIRWKRSLERVAALRIARSTKADPKESYRFYFCIWRTASPGILIRNVQGSDGPVPSWRELAIATYNMNVHVNVFGPGTSVQDLELFQN
ncbi:hypothetical protein OBBRIDRAFT_117404 [Obba rivulosa]|uniref:Uncharacterized protein n=1 Tax=Obba rivulosa TaxID=1052685 RepID=A0A8E2DJM2_9APHY|nr:hypothetical protein OBBRIDRAFT_117404 [Obba rivulosa]